MPVSSSAGWVVHKFGGSSVADSACFHRVADILESQPVGRLGVVLSACKGVTDDLLALVAKAERQDPGSQTLTVIPPTSKASSKPCA